MHHGVMSQAGGMNTFATSSCSALALMPLAQRSTVCGWTLYLSPQQFNFVPQICAQLELLVAELDGQMLYLVELLA
jgi:hypothetical protein